MDAQFDPVVLRLIELLKKALPGCAEEDIFWGYHFVTGALMLTLARTGRIDKLSGGRCKSEDFAAVKERMASFMAAGFLAICKPVKRDKSETPRRARGHRHGRRRRAGPRARAVPGAPGRARGRQRSRRRRPPRPWPLKSRRLGGAALAVRRFGHRRERDRVDGRAARWPNGAASTSW